MPGMVFDLEHDGLALLRQYDVDAGINLEAEGTMGAQGELLDRPRLLLREVGGTNMLGCAARARIQKRILVREIVEVRLSG